MVMPVLMFGISDGTVAVALLVAVVILVAVVTLLSVLSTERFLAEAAERSNLKLAPQVPLLTGEVTASQAQSLLSESRLDLASAVHIHGISDETPEPAAQRELKRRTRVLSLLHRVTARAEVPVEPIVEPHSASTHSTIATVSEARRRRLEELLRQIGRA